MTNTIVIGNLEDDTIEMTERKGIGHPDTICDVVTEQISVALCQYYLEEFGAILHHNVDKALLVGGQSRPAYNGGEVVQPISLTIAGRATHQVGDKKIPVREIAIETAKKWVRENIRHLDVGRHLRVEAKIRPGSEDLVKLFQRFGQGEIPLANDTSFGAGFYPNSLLQKLIIHIEELLNIPETKIKFPFIGEDVKVMGVKGPSGNHFTVAIAIIDQYINDLNDYIAKIERVREWVVTRLNLSGSTVQINTADDYPSESIYLTVTGTSAEHGDDGQVGRGNRINGLITPYRPMSLEATSGKNPINHTGKIYNYLAMDLSRALVENQLVDEARVFLLSQIGEPINEPQLVHLQLKNRKVDKKLIKDLTREKLLELPNYWKRIIYQ
ncbi:methionine adenosyltransferase [Flavobacteriaceae bacterium TP-CH-4]|uniref:Methionine adenosyltransferase n=1 Tax=Pelagihabitans pacificus TaxID=2696054 RepID=A0A967AYI8_9FLAO|nr:methionine adenosyltransferase [Pelagihabitans pacificus]NHF59937.1 methionine adenosyltransferase [Pelagihabitans pacificus]